MKKFNPDNPDLSYLTQEEQALHDAVERGEFKTSKDAAQRKAMFEEAAKNTVQKKVLSLRVDNRDLGKIKDLAKRDGIPYTTLLQSIIHRFAEGTLKRAD